MLARAHSLFGDPPTSGASAAVRAGADLAGGGEVVGSGQQQISKLSGQLAASYGVFAADAGPALHALAGSDDKLGSHIEQAAAADRRGHAASRAVINGADADIAAMAPVSHTPAGQKALLAALRARVGQAQSIVADGKARDIQIAAQLRSLAYRSRHGNTGPGEEILGGPPSPLTAGPSRAGNEVSGIEPVSLTGGAPLGPIVWCIRPQACPESIGARCSIPTSQSTSIGALPTIAEGTRHNRRIMK